MNPGKLQNYRYKTNLHEITVQPTLSTNQSPNAIIENLCSSQLDCWILDRLWTWLFSCRYLIIRLGSTLSSVWGRVGFTCCLYIPCPASLGCWGLISCLIVPWLGCSLFLIAYLVPFPAYLGVRCWEGCVPKWLFLSMTFGCTNKWHVDEVYLSVQWQLIWPFCYLTW